MNIAFNEPVKVAADKPVTFSHNKQAVVESFSRHAQSYDAYADVQQKSANLLIDFIERTADKKDFSGALILEIGCGTGLFTEKLRNHFNNDDLVVSDISPLMIERCKEKIGQDARVSYALIDAETISMQQSFSSICSSFSLQWVREFESTIHKLLNHLEPQGQLFFAIPIEGSFSEWQKECDTQCIPFTANKLPDYGHFLRWCESNHLSAQLQISPITCSFASSLDFFKSLKEVGAAVNTNGQKLTITQLKRLTTAWDARTNGRIEVTYKVLCAKVTRACTK